MKNIKTKLVSLILFCNFLALQSFSAEKEWPSRINGSHYEQCGHNYGANAGGVKIDTVALTYEKWYSACGFSGTFWERGILRKGDTLTKTVLETAHSHGYPTQWDVIDPIESGAFDLNESNILIELNAEGEEYLRYLASFLLV